MRKGEDIRTHTADEIRAMRRRGEDRTDWAKVDAMTEADLERAIPENQGEDEDERDLEPDWTRAKLVMPRPKQSVHLRLDPEVVAFFKAGDQAPGAAPHQGGSDAAGIMFAYPTVARHLGNGPSRWCPGCGLRTAAWLGGAGPLRKITQLCCSASNSTLPRALGEFDTRPRWD
jgi:uncharacterized protein (DUF4415 family)